MEPHEIASVHPFRRTARKRERAMQAALKAGRVPGQPLWARGVRVEKAGLFQWAVVWTDSAGH